MSPEKIQPEVGDYVCISSHALASGEGPIDLNSFLRQDPFAIGKIIARRYDNSACVQFLGFAEGHSGDLSDGSTDKWWLQLSCLKRIGDPKGKVK